MTDVHTHLFCCEFLSRPGHLRLHARPQAIAEVASA
jgi:hypothetical protein